MQVIPGENKLTIQNFEKHISTVMLKKGKQYFDDSAILDIGESNGHWTAEIEGSDIYDAEVSLKDDNEVKSYSCNCPYDGDICKHLVAVFLAIREELKTRVTTPKKGTKKDPFGDLLNKISLEEYREFVRSYASKKKDFKIELEVYFAGKDTNIDLNKKYSGLIQKIVKKHASRGFIDYRASSGLSKEVDSLLDNGYVFAQDNNFKDALSVAKAVLKEMMQVVTFCDDSNGSISGIVFDAIKLIGEIAENEDTPIDTKSQLFEYLQKELNDREYFGYGDFGIELFAIFESLALYLNRHDEYLNFIDAQLPRLSNDNDDYDRKFFKTQKIGFLTVIGRDDDAEELIQQSLEISEVRQVEVNKAIDKGEFDRAKKLIADGIVIAERKKHTGTIFKWEQDYLRVAALQHDLSLVRHYCKKFAFDRWSLDTQYYKQWKATFTADEWPTVIENQIAETIKKAKDQYEKTKGSMWRPVGPDLLAALDGIYIEEKYWDRLFDLVKNEKSLHKIMQYQQYLEPLYREELLALYIPALELEGENAGDRSNYAALVRDMQRIIKDMPAGKEQVIAVARKLKEKYPRKPAMIDELNRILK